MTKETLESINTYEMTDEEFNNLDLKSLPEDSESESVNEQSDLDAKEEIEHTETEIETNEEVSTNTDEQEQVQTQESEQELTTDTGNDESVKTKQEPVEQSNANEQVVDVDESTQNNQADTTENVETENVPDYKSFYEQVTRSFKANGKEIQVTNPDDMITLMQQGVNYSKRMAGLKPSLGVLKTLEQHGLMDLDKLGYLIELHNQKPEAIAKLVKDSGIDLYSFDTEQANDYTPPKMQVTEYSDLETTINELQASSKTFSKVLDSVVNEWDEQSKQILSDNPQLLRVMDNQAENGLFEKITNAIEYEKMMGRLGNTPYIEAYRMLESQFLQANQTQVMQQPTQPQVQKQQPQSFTAPRPTVQKQQSNSNTEQKRKAANPQTSSTNKQQLDFDPLRISDEEFLKYDSQRQYF